MQFPQCPLEGALGGVASMSDRWMGTQTTGGDQNINVDKYSETVGDVAVEMSIFCIQSVV